MINRAQEQWIKQVESIVVHSQALPMWGSFPPFPWRDFSEKLSAAFGLKHLKITAGASEWKKEQTILRGMGRSPLQLGIQLSPLEEGLSLIFPAEDFSKLSSQLIHKIAGEKGFSDPYLQKGFFRYLTLEAIHLIDELQVFKNLTPKLFEMSTVKQDSYCIDLAIDLGKETIWGRLICPSSFQRSLKEHFAKTWRLTLPSPLYQEIFCTLSLHAGHTTLSQATWSQLNTGDFILLDHCSYSPNTKKGTFQLMLNHIPLFQVKLKDENVKILDYAFYYEDNKMVDSPPEDPLQEPLEEHEENNQKGAMEEGQKENEEGDEEGDMESPATHTPQIEALIHPEKVPLSLSIEVGKIKMSLEKLLTLKPGNVLNLSLQPLGVNLVVNGRVIARGDLIQIGDIIGVKVTEIGSE